MRMAEERQPAADDDALLAAAQAGDRDAYGELVRGHMPRALAVAHAVVGNRADAEDVAQEAFVRAFRNLSRFRPGAPFAPWLFRITTNVALDVLKHRRRSREEDLDDSHRARAADDADAGAVANERARRIAAAIEALPEMQRLVARFSLIEELGHDEIAAILDISEGTVRSHLSHAKQTLRSKLSDLYEVT